MWSERRDRGDTEGAVSGSEKKIFFSPREQVLILYLEEKMKKNPKSGEVVESTLALRE